MAKILQIILVAGFLSSSVSAYLTMDDFKSLILPKCYDRKDDKELINGQVSPIPNSLETFIGIVERLEEKYNMDKILRGLISRFRFDDVLLRYVGQTGRLDFTTRFDNIVRTAHLTLQDLLGGMTNELRNSDLSEDEECALYFMISHTVNDTVTPYLSGDEVGETIILNNRDALRYPREQGVVNLNGRTRHAFALGKVLLGILAGLQDSERTVSAESIYKSRMGNSGKEPPAYLKDVQVNVLHGVTIADVIAVTVKHKIDTNDNTGSNFLPNGNWDDSACPTKYTLDDNNGLYATRSLIRGAIDGLFLGKKIKQMRESGQELRLSQILRIYYNPRITSSDSSLSDITWCSRHSFFTSIQNEIMDQATAYYQLYVVLQDLSQDNPEDIKSALVGPVVSSISSDTSAMFDDMSGDSGMCGGGLGNKICETPRDIAVVLDMKADRRTQYEIIGNLSVGFHMSPSDSSVAVYSNGRSSDGTKLHTINNTALSGCASCAAKYYGIFDTVSTTVMNEIEVFRSLNRTLDRDDLPDDSDSEPGVPSKVVIYFNYAGPHDTYDLRKAVNDFRSQHSGTKIFAVGSKKENLRLFVENPDADVYVQDVNTILKSLKENVCKVPAQFQYQNCYKNSRSDEDSHVFRGFITPNHLQYWAMYPKYFLKSFNIKMTFTTVSGSIKVCYTRNYDEMYGTRQTNMKCYPVDQGKEITFEEKDPCKKRNVYNCNPFYFSIEAVNVPEKKCTDKMCRSPNQIEFEFKHTGISCNRGISFAATPMTLIVAVFMSIYFVFKH